MHPRIYGNNWTVSEKEFAEPVFTHLGLVKQNKQNKNQKTSHKKTKSIAEAASKVKQWKKISFFCLREKHQCEQLKVSMDSQMCSALISKLNT